MFEIWTSQMDVWKPKEKKTLWKKKSQFCQSVKDSDRVMIIIFIQYPLKTSVMLTLCDPIDGSPPGSPVPGILQARTLEWVAISFSNAWKWKVKVKSLSRVRVFATPWTAAHQAPPSRGFSRQEYWSGVPSPSPLKVRSDILDSGVGTLLMVAQRRVKWLI